MVPSDAKRESFKEREGEGGEKKPGFTREEGVLSPSQRRLFDRDFTAIAQLSLSLSSRFRCALTFVFFFYLVFFSVFGARPPLPLHDESLQTCAFGADRDHAIA